MIRLEGRMASGQLIFTAAETNPQDGPLYVYSSIHCCPLVI